MWRNLTSAAWNYRRLAPIFLTPPLLLPLPLVVGTKEAECGFVLLLMALFWTTECIPLAITAMFPAIFFPFFGIMKSSAVAMAYFKDFHFLLVGVICLATSIEKWGLHRRIALRLVTLVGVNPAWLMLGFMCGCGFLSMWVHNTSAVTMVMPIVEAVLQQILRVDEGMSRDNNCGLQLDEVHIENVKGRVREGLEETSSSATSSPDATQVSAPPSRSVRDNRICKAMCISVAYSSNIGGIATLPGTSPNLIFSEYLHQIYPECKCIHFGNWLLLCLPISALMMLLTWAWLCWLFIGPDVRSLWRRRGEHSDREKATSQVIKDEYRALGPMSCQEVFTLVVFLLMVLLWLTRSPGFIPGWSSFFPHHSGFISDATVALLLGLLFFLVPAYGPSHKYETMISWEDFQATMPWKVALLVGGGFALAEGTKAEAIHVNPLYVLIPATLCTSFSFLLPVSNPPNAVVFAYGHLNVMDMVKAGLGTNVIGLLAVLLAVTTWGVPLFSLDVYPDWAPPFNATTP
ncbi:solute carrier family 13 member 1 isoform X2 [Dunckerocampus dactyliophorus]|uniref:solute carrier family 13 member 1 isoform X2 n=1 Tax=Dunckerocampus dactyliophorus TaxID=161453 RepID=UPI002405EDA5|nr:solute carrier family 13 member 1 isoform X2 [Dunckerocampus dactyliophorus]